MQHLQPNTTLQGGKYRIECVLGQGGFGNTYLGYNTEFEETVAIKEFFMKGVTERNDTTSAVSVSNAENVPQFEEQKEKFKKEARRLRKLKSEHIVKVHDLFEENGTAYYVMDFIDGESLSERMKRTGNALTESETKDILIQIVDALKEVHAQQIWHLDLKPGNIMLDKNGKAYLIDFGASKQIRSNGGMTTSTALCYTPGFAPNEQVGQMFDRFGPWTDIYALGATIYNLLTNERPPMTIDIEEDEEDAFSFPKGLSDNMKKLVVWMMQPKRKKRPQSVEEVNKMLSENTEVIPNEEVTIIAGRKSQLTNKEKATEETVITSKEGQIGRIETNVILDVIESSINAPTEVQAIDLGLSVKWASCNVGTSVSRPAGGLYGWGDPTGDRRSLYVKDYVPVRNLLDTPPCNIAGTQFDIAAAQWVSCASWRMPSKKDWQELVEKCTWTRINYFNIKGFQVKGPNGNSIFLPFTGVRFNENISNIGVGNYWTSEIVESDRTCAYYFYMDKDGPNDNVDTRNYIYSGRAVRPVCDK